MSNLHCINNTEAISEIHLKYPELILEINAFINIDFNFNEKITNEQLAHEIILDHNYRIYNSVDNMSEMLLLIQEGLQQKPPYYNNIIKILCILRDGLKIDNISLTIKNSLFEIVDENFLQQQIEKQIYKWEDFINLVINFRTIINSIELNDKKIIIEQEWISIKEKLDNVTILNQSDILCDILKYLVLHVNTIRNIIGNQKLISLVPRIKQNGIKYEFDKFKQNLSSGKIKLDKTYSWIYSILIQNITNTNYNIIATGIIKLATEYKGINCPETLLLDINRLLSFKIDFYNYILIARIILCVREHFSIYSFTVQNINNVITTLTEMLLKNDSKNDISLIVAENVSLILGYNYFESIKNIIDILLRSSIDEVTKLIKNRITNIWYQIIISNDSILSSTISLGYGLESLWPTIIKTAHLLKKMYLVNINVHGNLYSNIICEEIKKIENKKT